MKKRMRLAAILLAVAMLFSIPVVAADNNVTTSNTTYMKSGDLNMPKLSPEEITELLRNAPYTTSSYIYEVEPSYTAPYSIGKVKDNVLQALTNRLNATRRLAGLPSVELDMGLCEDAQYGAVLMSAAGSISHTPSKPADMDEEFYQRGYAATTTSNLSAGGTVISLIDGCTSDMGNAESVGHRRWQFNPTLGKVGFGACDWGYCEKIFDNSGKGCDYDFISWPASGYAVGNTEVLDKTYQPYYLWSVTLNPDKYKTPDKSEIVVTLTRENDGRVWTFSGDGYKNPGLTPCSRGEYFNVNTDGCGVSNCIIFKPYGTEVTPYPEGGYTGTWTVKIDGLRYIDGSSVNNFQYQVHFFSTEDYGLIKHFNDIDIPNDTPFSDVKDDMWYTYEINAAYGRGMISGNEGDKLGINENCPRAEVVTYIWKLMGCPDPGNITNPFRDVSPNDDYYKAVLWAYKSGVTTGTTNTTFSPNNYCTRGQVVTFLWRAFGSQQLTNIQNPFLDIVPTDYYYDAVVWAYENAIAEGTSYNRFSPNDTCSRAHILAFVTRAKMP